LCLTSRLATAGRRPNYCGHAGCDAGIIGDAPRIA
jgi:hypothetical protein